MKAMTTPRYGGPETMHLPADGRYVMVGVNADGRILGPMLPFLRLMVRGRFDPRARAIRAVVTV